jgi:hypothetical protein
MGHPLVRCTERVEKVTGSQNDSSVVTEEVRTSNYRCSMEICTFNRFVISSGVERSAVSFSRSHTSPCLVQPV